MWCLMTGLGRTLGVAFTYDHHGPQNKQQARQRPPHTCTPTHTHTRTRHRHHDKQQAPHRPPEGEAAWAMAAYHHNRGHVSPRNTMASARQRMVVVSCNQRCLAWTHHTQPYNVMQRHTTPPPQRRNTTTATHYTPHNTHRTYCTYCTGNGRANHHLALARTRIACTQGGEELALNVTDRQARPLARMASQQQSRRWRTPGTPPLAASRTAQGRLKGRGSVHTDTHTHAHARTPHTHTHTSTHAHINTRTRTHTHTHTHAS